MSFEIREFFVNVPQGLANIGFFFGAGCSMKTYYTLMSELTVSVIGKLKTDDVGEKLEDFINYYSPQV